MTCKQSTLKSSEYLSFGVVVDYYCKHKCSHGPVLKLHGVVGQDLDEVLVATILY